MALQSNPYILWQLIPGIILLWIGLYIQSRPIKKRESKILSIFMFAGAIWAFASAIQFITLNYEWQKIWNNIAYIGILIIPTAWFLLAIKITGFSLEHIQRIEKWLWSVPILTYLVILTNDFHKLFFAAQTMETVARYASLKNEFGPLFYLHTFYSYLLLFAGIIILGLSAVRDYPKHGARTYGIVIGVLAPVIANIYFLFRDIPPGFPDPTPIAFTISGVAFAWAIIGGRMLEIIPQAHDAIVQNLSMGILVLDSDHNILYVNPAAAEILDIQDHMYQGGTLSELIKNTPAIEPLVASFDSWLDSNIPLEITIPETGRTFDVSVSPVGDNNNKEQTGWLVQFSDISQVLQAEANLATTRETFETILDTLQDSYFEADPNGVITYANQAFIRALGLSSHAEAVGKHFRHFIHRKSIRDIFESFKILYETRQPQKSFQYYYTRKGGEERIAEIAVSPIFEGTEIVGSRGMIRDITERLKTKAELDQAHATYRAVLDTLQDPYFEADRVGRITYGNLGFTKAVGFNSRDDVIGMHFRHFTQRSAIRDVFRIFNEVFETKQPAAPFEYHYRNSNGIKMVGIASVSPILEGDNVIGTRGIIRDISVRVEAEKILREAKDAAEHRAGELAAINRVAMIVNRSLDLDEILQSICVEFTKIFPVRNAGIALLNEAGTHLEVIAFHAVDPDEESALGLILELEGNLASQEVLKTKSTVVIQDAQTDPRTKPLHELSKKRGSRSFMIVPLLSRGQTIGTIGMPAKDPTHVFGENETVLAETIANQIAAAIDNARLYGQTETALGVVERDLEIGKEIQSGFFPEILPEISGWEISAHFQAARQVAGDFYDIFQFRDSNFTAFIIADVCDKGVGAALFMVLFRSLLRAFSEIEIYEQNVPDQLKEIVLKTNNFIAEFHGRSNMFSTLFFGILDPDQGILYYINGGHEPPIIMNKDGKITQRLMPTGPAVGMFPDMVFEVIQIQLDPGDILLGFTDGVTDAKNGSGDLFSEKRLLESIQAPWTSIFSMVFELYTALRNHIGGQNQYDDITLISFRRKNNLDADYHAICRVAKLDILGELRDFVEAAAMNTGLDSENVFAFKLATEEVCTNIIQYGFEGQEPGFIAIAFEKDVEKATLTIWDDGIYFSPDQIDTPDINANWEVRQIGGLGIYLVKELMDNVSYNIDENHNNVLVLEKLLLADKLVEE